MTVFKMDTFWCRFDYKTPKGVLSTIDFHASDPTPIVCIAMHINKKTAQCADLHEGMFLSTYDYRQII